MGNRRARRGEALRFLLCAIERETDDCIIWPFHADIGGYGKVGYKGRGWCVSRLALVLSSGQDYPVREMHAAHGACANRLCINPRHLSWKTNAENQVDRIRDGTHICGELSYNSRLTDEKVRQILVDQRTGREIAEEYGVSEPTIWHIKRGRSWKHVPRPSS